MRTAAVELDEVIYSNSKQWSWLIYSEKPMIFVAHSLGGIVVKNVCSFRFDFLSLPTPYLQIRDKDQLICSRHW